MRNPVNAEHAVIAGQQQNAKGFMVFDGIVPGITEKVENIGRSGDFNTLGWFDPAIINCFDFGNLEIEKIVFEHFDLPMPLGLVMATLRLPSTGSGIAKA